MAAPMMPPDHNVLDNPYGGRGPLVMAVTWAQASIALTLMLMRTYTNAYIVKSWKWDYFWALFTFVTGMVAQAMISVSCIWGLGNHLMLLGPQQLVKANLWSWMGQIVAVQGIGFGKLAVIAFLLRIQDRTNSRKNRFLVYMLWFIGISNVIININQMILILLQCSPVDKLWNMALPGTCNHILRTNHVAYFQGSWAAMSDFILALYPVIVFWSLKISTKIKVGLCFLMAGGLIACAAGIVKTVNLKLIAVEHDITYFIADLVIWAYTELWLVLILGSLPPLRPLFVRVFYKLHSTYSNTRSRRTASNYGGYGNATPGGGRPRKASKYGYGYFSNSQSQTAVDTRHSTLGRSGTHGKGGALEMMYTTKSSATGGNALSYPGATATGDSDSERKILGSQGGNFMDQKFGGGPFDGEGILRTTHVHVSENKKAHTDSGAPSDDSEGSRSSVDGLDEEAAVGGQHRAVRAGAPGVGHALPTITPRKSESEARERVGAFMF